MARHEPLKKLPRLSKKELERIRREILEERKRFIDMYVEWLKSKSVEEWSRQQKKFIDSALKKAKRKRFPRGQGVRTRR